MADDRWCKWCHTEFPGRRSRRTHPCPDRAAAERAAALRWPTEPVERYLLARLGEYDHHSNRDGYCAAAVERVTGMKASVWKELVAHGRPLNDAQADKLATALGVPPVAFWPDWYSALDITDDDRAWLDAWLKGVA